MSIIDINDTILKDSLKIKNTLHELTQNTSLIENCDDNTQLYTNLITIFLALIAALIALYQVKLNTISSARITWIENLRDSISNYTAEVTKCAIILENMSVEFKNKNVIEIEEILKNDYEKYVESSYKSEILASKIKLYLNSNEKEHQKIEFLINKITNHIHEQEIKDIDRVKLQKYIEEIIKISKQIFKKEWKKSKQIFKI